MPMIDVYATGGTFANQRALARDLASTLMKIEQVPDIPMFRNNTAAFIHDLPDGGAGSRKTRDKTSGNGLERRQRRAHRRRTGSHRKTHVRNLPGSLRG